MTKEQLKNAVIVLTTFAAEQQEFITVDELTKRGFPWACVDILTMDSYKENEDDEDEEPWLGYDVASSIIKGLRALGYVLR